MTNENTAKWEFAHIKVNEAYQKEWNIGHMCDFLCIMRGSELVRPTLYRIGGINTYKKGDKYRMVLKYVESYYSDKIMEMVKPHDPNQMGNKYLNGIWCILDTATGDEKVVFEKSSLDYPSLVSNSCLYSINGSYYNIETGECYGKSSGQAFESSEFIFIEVGKYSHTKDIPKGVMKINKENGTWELFK